MITGSLLGILSVPYGSTIPPGGDPAPGGLKLILRTDYNGFPLVGGTFPAVAGVYDLTTNTLDGLYQRPFFIGYDETPTDETNFYVMAVDGFFLISAQVHPSATTSLLAITYAAIDIEIVRAADWASSWSESPEFIDLGSTVAIRDVVIAFPGCMVILVEPRETLQTVLQIPVVRYAGTDADDRDIRFYEVDLFDITGQSDLVFTPGGSVFIATGKIDTTSGIFTDEGYYFTVSFQVVNSSYAPFSVSATFDIASGNRVNTGFVTSWIPPRYASYDQHFSGQWIFDRQFIDFSTKLLEGSYNGIRVVNSSNMGMDFAVTTYTDVIYKSDIDEFPEYELVEYVDESEPFNVHPITYIRAMFSYLGYDVTGFTDYSPNVFPGLFTAGFPAPVASQTTFTGSLFGYYAWYGFPNTDEIGSNSQGFATGLLKNVSEFTGPSGTPSYFGNHLGIHAGYIGPAIDGNYYAVLVLHGSTGTENIGMQISGYPSELMTTSAVYEELTTVWPGHYGYFWNLGSGEAGWGFDTPMVTLTNYDV